MKCPTCHHQPTNTLFVQGRGSTRKLPVELRGYAVVRRRRECPACRASFWTIEAHEDDFKNLTTAPAPAVRP